MDNEKNVKISEPSKILYGINSSVIISIIVAVVLIGGVFFVSSKSSQQPVTPNATPTTTVNTTGTNSTSNVTIENGVQIIALQAKGGYSPRSSRAKAGLPTVIRFSTNGTFDCSASIRLPNLNVSRMLPQTGTTDISLGTPSVGLFRGSCGMGMYPFEIDFE